MKEKNMKPNWNNNQTGFLKVSSGVTMPSVLTVLDPKNQETTLFLVQDDSVDVEKGHSLTYSNSKNEVVFVQFK